MISSVKLTREIKLILGILSLSLFFYYVFLYKTVFKNDPLALPTPQPKIKEQVLGTDTKRVVRYSPIRLQIPSINIDAAIEHVGNTPDGEMAVPSDTEKAGWYEPGVSPGDKGGAVISGHFNGKDGKPGLFKDLVNLKQGDMILVTNELGITSTFKVRESRTYNPGYAEEVFSPKDNGTHLNLKTCDGIWDSVKGSFTKRLVVFADHGL